jgi:hypothetical protein
VQYWRGVERLNEGSARRRAELNRALGERLRGKALPPEHVERRRRTALGLGQRPRPPHSNGRPWPAEEPALLGALPDDVVAPLEKCLVPRGGVSLTPRLAK